MKSYIASLLIVLVLLPSAAAAHQWEADRAHSEVRFEIQHIFSTVTGHFSDYATDIFFDPDRPGESRFNVTVRVGSIDTKIDKRDNHLKSADFFDESAWPEMSFASTRVTHVSGNSYRIDGFMTIKGTKKPMTVDLVYWGEAENPFNKDQVVGGFDTRFTIDRLVFGVGDGSFYEKGIVGKDVTVMLSFECLRDR